jgi:hypothetical protein
MSQSGALRAIRKAWQVFSCVHANLVSCVQSFSVGVICMELFLHSRYFTVLRSSPDVRDELQAILATSSSGQ